MQYIAVFIILVFSLEFSFAASTDDELAAAITHYESIIFSSVADRVSYEIENAKLTEQQAADWIGSITNSLAVCDLEALTILGNDVRAESIGALADGAGKEAIHYAVEKKMDADPNFKAVVLEYSKARRRCIEKINQEFGIDYY